MGVFDHRHHWRPVTDLTAITNPLTGKRQAAVFIEECSCGAVRSIEFKPGSAPVVRESERGGV